MKIGGMGEEALVVELSELRRLGEIPPGVEIVRVLPPLNRFGGKEYSPEWIAGNLPFPPLYLHIRHRYCMRAPHGTPLMYDSLDRFLVRFREIRNSELEQHGKPVPKEGEDMYGCWSSWVDDDA